ncbi:MAG: hypothetical protein WDN06_19565 [Asticcacaulis sp.]
MQWFVRGTLRLFGVRMSMETDVLAAHEEIRGAHRIPPRGRRGDER